MSAMPKQKSCAVCGETELKRFRVVTGINVKAWSQLVGNQTLYAGDRICGSHLPIGWKKKAAKFAAESSELSREERDHHENHQPPGDSSLMVIPPSPTPQNRISWEHHHHQQHLSVSPNNLATKFRLHANLKGTSVKFIVPVDPKITVRELAAEIALRYSELLSSKRAVKKVFVYEVTSIEDFSQSALYWKDQLIDVVDNNSLIRFEGRRITGPKGPRKPKADQQGEGEKANEDGAKVEGERRADEEEEDDDDGVIEEDEEDEEEEEEDEEDEEDEEEQISEEEEEKVAAEPMRKRKGDAIEEEEAKKKKKVKKNE